MKVIHEMTFNEFKKILFKFYVLTITVNKINCYVLNKNI